MAMLSRQELTSGWSFREVGETNSDYLPVLKVPSQIHIDLLAHKLIPDPFLDLNERAVQWIGERDWAYRTEFRVAPAKSNATTELVFEGLDTFATVKVNGKEVLKTDNMFVSYRADVSHVVKYDAPNELEIVFDSALLKGRQLVEEHRHEHDFLVRQTEVGRVSVRKAQYNWGWDWGPILMTCGPWKPVYVEQYVARIDDVWVKSQLSEDLKTCSGTIIATVSGRMTADDSVSLSLKQPGQTVTHESVPATSGISREDDTVLLTLSKDGNTVIEESVSTQGKRQIEVPFTFENPELWYPHGYGSQTRYELQAKIVHGDKEVGDCVTKLVGFRRTELVQQPDAKGKSFYFRINNIDIFAGGSCWIPADSFLSRITPARYRDWMKLMVEGNQIMLRVWGGGIYEDDALLDACDELGILVWHDFQFACASYPTYESYLHNFEHEARQQVRRLRWRPAVVIWAGNNEDYEVQQRYKLDYNFEDKDPESWLKSSWPARYIYEHLLPKVINEEDPHKIYHPSSPWGDGKHTTDPTVGDTHQWNLWHGAMHKYQEADQLGSRFVSEFGMEAYPHLQTIERMISEPSQRRPGSIPMDFHNKGIGHERRLITYIAENFQLSYDLASFTHLSQIVQSDCMRAAYKAWRRNWGTKGERGCGGVLVWQLNDCWPTMSWAVVDYYLIKKPAFYAIKRALQSMDVGVTRKYHDWTQTGDWVDEHSGLKTGQVDQTLAARDISFDVWIASSDVDDATVDVETRFVSIASGKDVADPIRTTITAVANSTTAVLDSQRGPAAIPDAGNGTVPFDVTKYDPYVIHVTLSISGKVIARDSAWPDPVKFIDMPNRGIRFDHAEHEDHYSVSVTADRPVKGFVFEEVEGLELSNNSFDVMPGEQQVVHVGKSSLLPSQLKWTHIGASRPSNPMP